ncbi:RecX family transcriptional regulator [Litoribacter ruber]|uniref:Regulatory protein RecX n=1 Tax=Litoribacter ruber TaxID=702568 RepID=A0AAP2G1Z1_9BACT|nr:MULTISPECIES: regulatory protein RecX [Litoribacter]MBS9525379.1 RecX family transcriptional regulator [Litoribacter alkaliphilus]MBT0809765.1 RecX family transcriptional regulator [Litoribacter ruber]
MSFQRKDYAESKAQKKLTPSQAKVKIGAYCAYQERCQQEVRDKLYSYGLHSDEVEELISFLITEGFLNEERFAQAFVGGKFRIKKWGRNKILQELKLRKISPNCIKAGMKEIDPEEYWGTLKGVFEKKWDSLKDKDNYIKRQKVMKYLLSRGFEMDLVQDVMRES